jgi:hypothetical protein
MTFSFEKVADTSSLVREAETQLGVSQSLGTLNLDVLKKNLLAAFVDNVGAKVGFYREQMQGKCKDIFSVLKDISNLNKNEKLLQLLSNPSFKDRDEMFNMQQLMTEAKDIDILIRDFVKSDKKFQPGDLIGVIWPKLENHPILFDQDQLIHLNRLGVSLPNENARNEEIDKIENFYDEQLNRPFLPRFMRSMKDIGAKFNVNPTDGETDFNFVKRVVDAAHSFFKDHKQYYENGNEVKNPLGITMTDMHVLATVSGMDFFNVLVSKVKSADELGEMFEPRFGDLKAVVEELLSASNACGNLLKAGEEKEGSRYSIESTCANFITGFAANPATFRNQHLNMLLMGGAGMGKTRYAGMMGRVLKGTGILLSKKPVDICSRGELVGQYLGQTAPRTASRLLSNLESVMVIDEAYRLSVRNTRGWEEFGQEAIGEIVNFLDKRKGQICVIAAGYEKEMTQDFLAANEGLPRRFIYHLTLPAYTDIQLANIFCVFMTRAGLRDRLTPDAMETLVEILKTDHVRDLVFPNGAGDIENFAANVQTTLASLGEAQIDSQMLYNLFKLFCVKSKNRKCHIPELGAKHDSVEEKEREKAEKARKDAEKAREAREGAEKARKDAEKARRPEATTPAAKELREVSDHAIEQEVRRVLEHEKSIFLQGDEFKKIVHASALKAARDAMETFQRDRRQQVYQDSSEALKALEAELEKVK